MRTSCGGKYWERENVTYSGRTNRRTDGQTDGRMNKERYRVSQKKNKPGVNIESCLNPEEASKKRVRGMSSLTKFIGSACSDHPVRVGNS